MISNISILLKGEGVILIPRFGICGPGKRLMKLLVTRRHSISSQSRKSIQGVTVLGVLNNAKMIFLIF